MERIFALVSYFKTEKARRDITDYIRAAVIIVALAAVIRIIVDMANSLLFS